MSRIAPFGEVRQREPRTRDRAHLARVAQLPCIACAVRQGIWRLGVQVAHVRCSFPEPGWREVGKAEKPSDFRVAPLCVRCHLTGPEAQHGMNERVFWESLGIYPPAFCAALVAAFAAGENGRKVVDKFAAEGQAALALRRRGTDQ